MKRYVLGATNQRQGQTGVGRDGGGKRGSSGLVREGEWTRFWMEREWSSERGEAGGQEWMFLSKLK